jgi:hypothetical protein
VSKVEVEHKLVEMMATRWDEQGHRPPTHWFWRCTCGVVERELPGQIAAIDSWREHRREAS